MSHVNIVPFDSTELKITQINDAGWDAKLDTATEAVEQIVDLVRVQARIFGMDIDEDDDNFSLFFHSLLGIFMYNLNAAYWTQDLAEKSFMDSPETEEEENNENE